ncbi:MAG: [Fe-Fe] hydrogenase large subunit C-terminal domain-containing protein [Clostridia bacterium]|nr:[Fe-Fe] hydrogenase large subunit C-terminal domain-containing protein [Clostridia bacterium]
METDKSYCAVKIDKDKCKGCINCMKKCPTEAIRVRNGKATINYDRCVGCGECIRTCTHNAKYATSDSLDLMNDFKYTVALVPPSLLGQFPNVIDPSVISNSMKNIGFDDFYEVARGADLVSALTRKKFEECDRQKPLISTACPVCVELILIRFNDLKDYLIDIMPPLEIAAKIARKRAMKATGLASEDIGVFFISPCPAKVASTHRGFYTENPGVDGVFAMSDICLKLMHISQAEVDITRPIVASNLGVAWATSGGEVSALDGRVLAADGIENVISVLKELESGKLKDIDYVELNACPGGCVGGVFTIENPFVAKSKIHTIRRTSLYNKKNTVDKIEHLDEYLRSLDWETDDVFVLDKDFKKAFVKLRQVEQLLPQLPQLDCGVCGSPSCRAFAEDVVNGIVTIDKCVRQTEENGIDDDLIKKETE